MSDENRWKTKFRRLRRAATWKRFFAARIAHFHLWILVQPLCLQAYRRMKRKLGAYQELSAAQLTAAKKGDTLFIFGSGSSLNSLTPADIALFERHDTMAFNWFAHQEWVRIDYYLLKEITPSYPYNNRLFYWYRELARFGRLLRRRFYDRSIFIVQKGWLALDANRLIGFGFLRPDARLFRFATRSRGRFDPPRKLLNEGLTHGPGTLAACLNFAYQMRWKRVVLVGVDLYDRRYFWLRSNETRLQDATAKASYRDPHPTAERLLDFMRFWKPYFDAAGMTIEVYNPRSLLRQVFPAYDRSVIPGYERVDRETKASA